MKKYLYIFLVAVLISACDKGFDELNVDPLKPIQVEAKFKLTSAQLFTSGQRYENWRANLIYQSTMMQHLSTTAGYWAGDKYTWNRGYASSLIDRYYGTAVKTLQDLIVQLDSEAQPDEMKAIARIMRVFVFHRLTDLYGDIPYSESGQAIINPNPGSAFVPGSKTPKYDKQSEIYADMLKELEESVAALSGTGTSEFGDADIIFNGDIAKWRKFGNSMMLRLGLRMIKIDPAASQSWATKAIAGGVMESNADIAYIQHATGPEGVNKNGNGETFSADGNPRISETFYNFLKDDPRLLVLGSLPENTGEKDGDDKDIKRTTAERTDISAQKGLPNGLDSKLLEAATGELNTQAYTEPNRLLITGEDAPMFFQTYAEVAFMVAEANVRWGIGTDAATSYNDGVTGAMSMLSIYGDGAIIDPAAIAQYLVDNPFDAGNALEQINTQYWAATFLNEYESFSNWRRTGFPVLVPVNYPGNVTNGTIPRRLTYSTSEESTNTVNYNAAVAAQGPDELTTRVWWDN